MPGKKVKKTKILKPIKFGPKVEDEDCTPDESDKTQPRPRWKRRALPVWKAAPQIRPRFDPKFDYSNVITIDTSHAKSNTEAVRLAIRELGWKEFPFGRKDNGPCDIYWHSLNFYENTNIESGKVNKFPGMSDVVKKINLCRTLDMMREIYPTEYDFYPKSWFLPFQFHEFCAEVAMARREKMKHQKLTYIVKPDEGAQGDGIFLLRNPSDYIIGHKCHIVQEYIAAPLLIEGYKFDLRLYVVLLSLKPLKFHLAKEGLARFCTVPYDEPKPKNLHQTYMHLTNYSLNKHSNTYVHTDQDHTGSKRTVGSVFRQIESLGHDSEQLWRDVEQVVVKTMLAITPELQVEYKMMLSERKSSLSCFQVLGFDVLIQGDLKPMLLEINSGPSLRVDYEQEVRPGVSQHVPSAIDEDVKKTVLKEALQLVAPDKRPKSRKESFIKCSSRPSQGEDDVPGDGWYTAASFHYDQQDGYYSSDAENGGHGEPQNDPECNSSDNHDSTKLNGSHQNGDYENVNSIHGNLSHSRNKRNGSKTSDEGETRAGDVLDERTLYELYPDKYGTLFDHLRLLDRVAAIFLYCLGVRASLRIGPTGFRTFTRKCKLTSATLNNAAIDIMYIELQRKWEFMNPDRTAGLCFQGFVDAFYDIAHRKFRSPNKVESVEYLLDHCEANLRFGKYTECKSLPKVELSKAEKKLHTLREMYLSSPEHRKRFLEFSRSRTIDPLQSLTLTSPDKPRPPYFYSKFQASTFKYA